MHLVEWLVMPKLILEDAILGRDGAWTVSVVRLSRYFAALEATGLLVWTVYDSPMKARIMLAQAGAALGRGG